MEPVGESGTSSLFYLFSEKKNAMGLTDDLSKQKLVEEICIHNLLLSFLRSFLKILWRSSQAFLPILILRLFRTFSESHIPAVITGVCLKFFIYSRLQLQVYQSNMEEIHRRRTLILNRLQSIRATFEHLNSSIGANDTESKSLKMKMYFEDEFKFRVCDCEFFFKRLGELI